MGIRLIVRRWALCSAVVAAVGCAHAPPPWPGGLEPLRTAIVVTPAVPALEFRRSFDRLEDIGLGPASGAAAEIGVQGSFGGGDLRDVNAGIAITVIVGEALAGWVHADVPFERGGRALLATAIAERPIAPRLAAALPSPPGAGADPAWTAVVEPTRLVMLGAARGAHQRLMLEATLTLQRRGDTQRHGPWTFDARTVDPEGVGLWEANDRAFLHASLDRLVESLAAQILTAMRQHAAAQD